MTQITPNVRFLQHLLPAILLEGVVMGLWVIMLLMRHRDEWRVTSRKVF